MAAEDTDSKIALEQDAGTSNEEEEKKEDEVESIVLKIQSNEGDVFSLTNKIVQMSVVLSRMMEDLNVKEVDQESQPLPIDARSEVLKKIMDWCDENEDKPKREKRNAHDNTILLTSEDYDFLQTMNTDFFIEVLTTAHFLDIRELVDIMTQKIASLAQGKSVEELREVYMLPDDLSEEEKKAIREKYAWVEP